MEKMTCVAHLMRVVSSLPGTMRTFVFGLMGCSFLSQLRSGAGKPDTSQVKEMKWFTTTERCSWVGPMTPGGTVNVWVYILKVNFNNIRNTFSNSLWSVKITSK